MGKHKKHHRPMRDLLLQMPMLQITPDGEIDYAASNPALLVQIANNAETSLRTIHLGLAAVGVLLAHSAPEIETRDISGDAVEALGWFMAELGEFAIVAHSLSAACRRYTADDDLRTTKAVPNARV